MPGLTTEKEDVNECLIHPGICLNGDCENLFMSYRCLCRPGYKHADADQKVSRLCYNIGRA